ncbi:hypothetical protein Dimus_009278 [Dionaea muscipula]
MNDKNKTRFRLGVFFPPHPKGKSRRFRDTQTPCAVVFHSPHLKSPSPSRPHPPPLPPPLASQRLELTRAKNRFSMTGQIVIQLSPSSKRRRQPLLFSKSASSPSPEKVPASTGHNRVGEVAGGAAAGCAAVCCCCPLVVMECLITAIYKVPSSLCRRIKRKRKKQRRVLLRHVDQSTGGSMSSAIDEFSGPVDPQESETIKVSVDEGSAEAIDLDKQMWERFRNAGFWRSQSQRHVM